MKKIYFDNAATTKIDPSVLTTINNVMKENYGNPSSSHSFGRASRTIVEKARKSIAQEFCVSSSEIFFTSGGTESDNMVLVSAVRDLKIQTIITSKVEHHAVLNVAKYLEKKYAINVIYVKIDSNGSVDYKDLEQILESNKSKTLVSLMHVNNEIGSILDIKRVGNICKKHNAIFHSDTVQSIGRYGIDLSAINVDFIVGSAHKFHGPKGIGFVYISENIKIKPLLRGGSQERNMRAGTENIYGIAGLALAMELAYKNLKLERSYIEDIKLYMIEKLTSQIVDVQFYAKSADIKNSLYTVLSCHFPETDIAEMLLFNLDILGIACSGGSACASGSNSGSHVLSEIVSETKRPGIRFSFSKFTTKDDIDYTVKQLKTLFP